jgi:hypothetical protein
MPGRIDRDIDWRTALLCGRKLEFIKPVLIENDNSVISGVSDIDFI